MSEIDLSGVRKATAVALVIAAATPTLVHTVVAGSTFKLKKIMTYNGQPADVILELGMGAGVLFTRSIPRMRLITGFHDPMEEGVPAFEFTADIYAQASAAGAGALGVEVQLECEIVR